MKMVTEEVASPLLLSLREAKPGDLLKMESSRFGDLGATYLVAPCGGSAICLKDGGKTCNSNQEKIYSRIPSGTKISMVQE
jgi:hypothetical protein